MPFYHKIHCSYTGIKGFLTVYNDALRYRYMITEHAKHRAKVLTFWERHGLEATTEAFRVRRRTLYNWQKKLKEGSGKLEALNKASTTPRVRRSRSWPIPITSELKRIRSEHPNLGKEKIYPLLQKFCTARELVCPRPRTIGRLVKDLGGLRMFPQKVRHNGSLVPQKRKKVIRKPKDVHVEYLGHLVALDTIEKIIHGSRRYVITFEDIYTRFSFAWATMSHASLAATEFFGYCQRVFPAPMAFVLTDNGSEFAKHFAERLKELHLTHYHTYPETPKMNAHVERFNRTIQEEFMDYHMGELLVPQTFNNKLIDWLIWYNTERVHYAFQNKLSPVQFMLTLQPHQLPKECKMGWPHTFSCIIFWLW